MSVYIKMNVSSKLSYNLECRYIHNVDDRCRYLINRRTLFSIYDELYSVFDRDYDE